MTQPSLIDLAARVPTVAEGQVEQLIAALRGQGWIKREDVARRLGWSVRRVRAAAEHSQGAVIGTNSGLALVWDVPAPDAERAARRLEHQATANWKRAKEIRMAMHRRAA